MGLVGQSAPDFTASAAQGKTKVEFSLKECRGKPVVLFFYPLDFTFVCPTELHAFQEKLSEFHARGVEVIGCSVDSIFCHLAYLNTPKEQGGIQGVTYPLVSDITKQIAHSYGVLKKDEGVAYRGLFLIDKDGIVRHELINDLPLGRSVDEALRMVDALLFHETYGEVCPANWSVGKKTMQPNEEGLHAFFATE